MAPESPLPPVAAPNQIAGKVATDEVRLVREEFLEGTIDPYYEGSFDWGERAPHCYSGEPAVPGQTSYQGVLPLMRDRILATAPAGADVTSWRYD